MPLSDMDLARFSRFGMVPFNWIVEGKLLASVYPSPEYLEYLNRAEDIRLAVNLTESPWDSEWSSRSNIRCIHFPVRDMMTPDPDGLKKVLKEIDSHKGPVMVHCAAGIGRTGTLMAVYLVQHGYEPEEAISTVRRKRPGSIQTTGQETLIMNWKP